MFVGAGLHHLGVSIGILLRGSLPLHLLSKVNFAFFVSKLNTGLILLFLMGSLIFALIFFLWLSYRLLIA